MVSLNTTACHCNDQRQWPKARRSTAMRWGLHIPDHTVHCIRHTHFIAYQCWWVLLLSVGYWYFNSTVLFMCPGGCWEELLGEFVQQSSSEPRCPCGCIMPTGWRVKLCTGAPSASHQNHDRWSSVQANFLLLWLCLLSSLISNAVMKSRAIEGKRKVWFSLFFELVL